MNIPKELTSNAINKHEYFDTFLKDKMGFVNYFQYFNKYYVETKKLNKVEQQLLSILCKTSIYNWLQYAHSQGKHTVIFRYNQFLRNTNCE